MADAPDDARAAEHGPSAHRLWHTGLFRGSANSSSSALQIAQCDSGDADEMLAEHLKSEMSENLFAHRAGSAVFASAKSDRKAANEKTDPRETFSNWNLLRIKNYVCYEGRPRCSWRQLQLRRLCLQHCLEVQHDRVPAVRRRM